MTLLTVTSRSALERVFGPGAYERVCRALDEHAQARGGSGETWRLVPDDPASARLWGLREQPVFDATVTARAITHAHAEHPFDAVLIVGGPEIVPHATINNLVDIDLDATIATDNVYGCSDDLPNREIVPDLAIGRLVGHDLDGLIAHVETMIRLHRAAPARTGAAAIGCQLWASATTRVAAAMGAGAINSAPAFVAGASTLSTFAVKRLFVNLHGFERTPAWNGQSAAGMVSAIAPAALDAADLVGTVVFATNCYGAHVGAKSAATSCAMQIVARGARAFIGATCFSFGAGTHSTDAVRYADRLAELFFDEHVGGATAGEALTRARRRYVRETRTPHGVLPPHDHKTATQFLLLGDPTL